MNLYSHAKTQRRNLIHAEKQRRNSFHAETQRNFSEMKRKSPLGDLGAAENITFAGN